jgi:hypothetical protein
VRGKLGTCNILHHSTKRTRKRPTDPLGTEGSNMVLEGLAGAGCSPRQILNTIFSSHVLPKSPFPNFHLLEHNFDEKALSNEMKIRWKCH